MKRKIGGAIAAAPLQINLTININCIYESTCFSTGFPFWS